MFADTVTINGTEYQINVLEDKDVGPGIRHLRLRLPDYPLNVNILTMDMTNPYNRVETMQAYEELCKTEKLANAYNRLMTDEKRPIAAANGNFWCVSSQYPWSDLLIGATYNGNLRNGKIITETNAYSDQWDGGPANTGVVAVDVDKNLYCGIMYYKGYAINEKIGSPEIIQVNKIVRDGEIGLYNSFYGTSKSFQPVDTYTGTDGNSHFSIATGVSTEVYLNLNEGQEWMSGKQMECTVQKVVTDAGTGTLGSYDLCLVARGGHKDTFAQLAEGDQVTIDISWATADGDTPEIEQLIGGNAMVLLDGELTERNNNETYNSQVYSRCAYGSSADGNTLFVVIIDKSTSSYGTSAGCSTSVMSQIMQHYGCANLCNFDAGGSAQMMIGGEVINTTTESTPRAVANGFMLFSIAPQDDEIARLEFEDVTLEAPLYSTFTPVIIGYNQYGDIVDEDLQGFTLSCDESIGTCSGSSFSAGGDATTGNLTATYNGVSVTKELTVLSAEPAIRLKPLLIDAAREYTMEVTASIGETVYQYDPSKIEWEVEDASIAEIDENGTLRASKEGTTTITGRIGGLEDQTELTVEIANAAKLYPTDFTDWTISRPSGISNYEFSEDGTLSFTYASPREAYIQIAKTFTYYSLPDKLCMTFTSTIPVESLSIDLRTRENTRSNLISVTPTSGDQFAAGETYTVEFPISAHVDPEDLITFPITLYYIRFYLETSSANKGDHTINISELWAEYDNYDPASVETISVDKASNAVSLFPNPVVDGSVTVKASSGIEEIAVYNISGIEMLRREYSGEQSETLNVSSLKPGLYLVKVSAGSGPQVAKMIVK